MVDVDIDTLTMEQFIALARDNNGSGMHEDSYKHVQKVLEIAGLFRILNITRDVIMLSVCPITLTRAARRWKNMLPAGSINTWDHLEKSFIRKYCNAIEEVKYVGIGRPLQSNGKNDASCRIRPPGYYTGMENNAPCGEKKTRLVEKINRYIEESMKERVKINEWIKKLKEGISTSEMEEVKEVKKESVPRDLPILNRYREPYVPPIPFLGRFKEYKDKVQAFRIFEGLKEVKNNRHLINAIKRMLEYVKDASNQRMPLKEEGNAIEEVKYVGIGRPLQSNGKNDASCRIRPPGYYTGMENNAPCGEKKTRLVEKINRYIEESMKERVKINEWIKKLKEGISTSVGLKEVKNNRHLINAIKRMLEYVKYVKEIFSSKKTIKEGDAVKLNARRSTIL
nr:hypothetical protein [Tanacetum cinerariifolium]